MLDMSAQEEQLQLLQLELSALPLETQASIYLHHVPLATDAQQEAIIQSHALLEHTKT
jgi:hypothetical protein